VVLVYSGGFKCAVGEPQFRDDSMTIGCTTITREAWLELNHKWDRHLKLEKMLDELFTKKTDNPEEESKNMIDTQPIVSELRQRRDLVSAAIEALERLYQPTAMQPRYLGPPPLPAFVKKLERKLARKPRRRMSAASRARISKAMRASWKKRR
jgi:hypothetical protein